MMRAIQARANLSEGDQKCHQVLYRIEQSLRGRFADDRIFRTLLVLRREWIEKKLEYFEIAYVPWTMAHLRRHYDPANAHFFQPVRQTHVEYKRATDLHKTLYTQAVTGGVIDYRAMHSFCEMSKTCQSYREELVRRLDETEVDVAESLRVLAEAISRTTRDESILLLRRDPATAAGTAAKAGSESTPGGVTREEPNSFYEQQYVSNW